MKKKDLMKLREAKWETLFEGTRAEIEVLLVPMEAPKGGAGFLGLAIQQVDDRVVEKAFIDFRGYENGDGTPVPNSTEARAFLYGCPGVHAAINNTLLALNNEIMLGEDSSGSDSDSTESGSSEGAPQTAES